MRAEPDGLARGYSGVALDDEAFHATAMAAMRFGLSLEQRVRSQTGSHVATAAALFTARRYVVVMGAMRVGLSWSSACGARRASHVATAAVAKYEPIRLRTRCSELSLKRIAAIAVAWRLVVESVAAAAAHEFV